jgi:hypothetical protein
MQKRQTALVVASLALIFLAAVMVGGSFATQPAHTAAKSRTFNFVFRFSDSHTKLDLGASGFTTGDTETFSGPVNDANEAHRVGFGQGHCVVTLPGKPFALCNVTFAFPHGQIATQGPDYFNRPFNHAVLGGTGSFRSASGEMRVAPIENGEAWKITLKLLL